jgi:hypothetical protein
LLLSILSNVSKRAWKVQFTVCNPCLAGMRRCIHLQAGGNVQGYGALQGHQRGIQAVPPPHTGNFCNGTVS